MVKFRVDLGRLGAMRRGQSDSEVTEGGGKIQGEEETVVKVFIEDSGVTRSR